jgi:septum formation protein
MSGSTDETASQATLVLASASPRRRELLSLLHIPFTVLPALVDEEVAPGEPARVAVARLARRKARFVSVSEPDRWVLAADTLVECEGFTLGKPASADTARRSLRALRGRSHFVWTGICLLAAGAELSEQVSTRVRMRRYSDSEIERSIARGTPFDKAGGYGIQDEDLRPVKAIAGCYCNVMGLPLWTVVDLLHAGGFTTCSPPAEPWRAECAQCPLRG